MRYFNDTGVYCDVFGVKKFEYGVEMTIIVVAGWYFDFGKYNWLQMQYLVTFLAITLHWSTYQ